MTEAPIFNIETQLTPKELACVLNAIVFETGKMYNGYVDKEELFGFAQIGVVKAALSMRPENMTDKKKAFGWLVRKGIWNSIDEMRNLDIVDRYVNDKDGNRTIRIRRIKTVSMDKTFRDTSEVGARNSATFVSETIEQSVKDPSDPITAIDFMNHVMKLVRGTEFEIMHYYYSCRMPMESIGRVLCMSESRVSQIHREIVDRLKKIYCVS